MNLVELELTLADVQTSLLTRKCSRLEALLPDADPVDEATVASDGAKISTQSSGGGASGGPEGNQGYTVGQEGDIHLDGGGTKTPSTTMAALKAALKGGPGDSVPQTIDAKAAAAKHYTRMDRDNQGDIDHSGHQSGAGHSMSA